MTLEITSLAHLFHVDSLSLIVMGLVAFVTLCIASFSIRYLKGDRRQRQIFLNFMGLLLTVYVMVCADNIFLLATAWGTSNLLLTRLMLHKYEWEAARQSAILAAKNFAGGFIFMGAAMLILYNVSGETSIQAILVKPTDSKWQMTIVLLLSLAAMTQSAILPFHRWLTSSLNSPTPVSAIMHAGLVNGGGFLLARFAPIIVREPLILNFIFVVGMATALLGTLWKLMQSDIKRMLASSTMGQMGFMIAQCGLGLFSAAIAHLCWHGLFKAYLFLASGSAAKEKRTDSDYPPSGKHFFFSLICGLFTSIMFSLVSGKHLWVADTTLFLTFLAMIAGAQFSLPFLRSEGRARLPLAIVMSVIMGSCYGFSVYIIEEMLQPLGISVPQQLNTLHLIAATLLTVSWLGMLFIRPERQKDLPAWFLKNYVKMLNASQPHPGTITTHRNKYKF
jgi:NAD(P)H-quinone oxidoreductase subunit 5